jgi:hypothetical protein
MACSGKFETNKLDEGHAQPQMSHTNPLMLSSAISFLSGMDGLYSYGPAATTRISIRKILDWDQTDALIEIPGHPEASFPHPILH